MFESEPCEVKPFQYEVDGMTVLVGHPQNGLGFVLRPYDPDISR